MSAGELMALAGRLTDARKAMVMALPADGDWGRVPSRSVAKRAWWSMIPGIIDHKHCPEDANEWALTPYGQQLRAALAQASSDAAEKL